MTEMLENILVFLNKQDYLDILIYIFIFYLIVIGWKKGSLLIVFYIVGLLVSIFLSFNYSFFIGNYVGSWLNSNQQVSQIFAGLIIFISSITIFSLFQNIINFNNDDKDFGNKFLGSIFSVFLSNLILTLVISLISLFTLPTFIQERFDSSNLVSFYIEPEGPPQQSLELITGTDLLKVTNRIKQLTGRSSVVVDDFGCLEIPSEPLSKLISKDEEALIMFELIRIERINEDLDPLSFNQAFSNVAKEYAFKMYSEGFWCHQDPTNGYQATDRLNEVGFIISDVGENLAISSTIYSAHESLMSSESHKKTILGVEFKRVGIGVVSGPTGLMVVQIFGK